MNQKISDIKTQPKDKGLDSISDQHPCFKLSVENLQNLVDHWNGQFLHELGGVYGLANYLQTDLQKGLVSNESGIPGENMCTTR